MRLVLRAASQQVLPIRGPSDAPQSSSQGGRCMSNRPMCHAGIRVPDSAFVRQVCRKLRRAVALTSANLSGEPSPLAVSSGWIPAVSM